MKSLFIFIIFFYSFSYSSLGCDCVSYKSFMQNIKKSHLVVFAEVVSFQSGNNGFCCEELMGIKVLNSFGAKIESDTIWIKQSCGLDCNVSVDWFNESEKVYFALFSDSDCHNHYYISACGEHYLKTRADKSIAYGCVNFLHKRMNAISKNYTGKISIKKLNRKLYRKCKK